LNPDADIANALRYKERNILGSRIDLFAVNHDSIRDILMVEHLLDGVFNMREIEYHTARIELG